jgi:hypothetical protein
MAARSRRRLDSVAASLQIVFVHIPKTAGTAVREALFRARPHALNLCDYGPGHPLTSPLVKALRHDPGGDLRQLSAALERAPAYTLCGHLKAKPLGKAFGIHRLVTVLREPVERVVSNWRLCRRRGEFDGSLYEFARRPENRNLQARYTRPFGFDHWLFVARQDRLATDMAELSRRLGVALELEQVNAAPGPAPAIPAGDRRLIETLNVEDMELFESCASPDQEQPPAAPCQRELSRV